MLWDVMDRGFLPNSDPIQFIPIQKFEDIELIYTWENLSENVVSFLKEKCLREELIYAFRKSNHAYYFGFLDNLGSQSALERAFFLLCYFSNAYIHSTEGYKKTKLPKELSIPLSRAAHLVQRNPILNYSSYCLYNWKLKNKQKDISSSNIDVLLTFTGSEEERNIIANFVEFEYSARNLIIDDLLPNKVHDFICQWNNSFDEAKRTAPEVIEVLGNYLCDFDNIIYENWKTEPSTYYCNMFLQSPTLHLLFKYLGVEFRNDYIKQRLLQNLPREHYSVVHCAKPISNKFDAKLYRETLHELARMNDIMIFNEVDLNVVKAMNNEINLLCS